MDFKKLAQDKLDKISGFKSNTDESEFDDILEGLDLEIESVRKIDENQIELDLDDELDFEPVSKSNDQQVQNLFDGYIGEKNFIPNPYEYGPNATYRNVNEGIVYKKNSENLWEAFVKDGKSGQQGPRGFAGGGTGVEEVKKIATEIVTSAISNISISGSGISRTLSLSDLIATVPVSGTKGYTIDYLTTDLTSDGSKWSGFLGDFSSTSALSGISTANLKQGTTARITIGNYSEICFWSGTYWLVSNGENIEFPSTDLNTNVAGTLNLIFNLASTNNKRLILNNHYIGTSTTNLLSNSRVKFNGIIYGSNNGQIGVNGTNITLENLQTSSVGIKVLPGSENVNILNANIISSSGTPCILLSASPTQICKNINIINSNLSSGSHGIRSHAIADCTFDNVTVKDCTRSFATYSAERCIWQNCRSYGSPIVGMIFISYRSSSYNRGFVNNKIINPIVSGFKEEGISFDCAMNVSADNASVLHTYVSAVTSAGVQLSAWDNVDYSPYDIVFNSGKIAGKFYDIVSSNNGFITIKDFYEYNNVAAGDFIEIETKCRGNVFINPTIIGTTDPSGLVYWGFGKDTTVRDATLINCNIDLGGICNNVGPGGLNGNTGFLAPHGIKLENIKCFGKGDYGTFDSWVYSGIKVHLYRDWFDGGGYWYSSSASPEQSLPPEKMFIYDISINNCNFKDAQIDHVQNLEYRNNKGDVVFSECKNIYNYTHPTFKNDIININSIQDVSAFNGIIGQTLICKDPYFQNQGIKFEWDSYLNNWILNDGQYLVNNYPTSSQFNYTFSATSADHGTTKDILIGIIPKNIIYSGKSVLNIDAVVEANAGTSATMTFKLTSGGTNLPTGPSFTTTAASTRSMLNTFILGLQAEGTSAIADKIRCLGWGNSSGISATRTVDFSNDVPVYLSIVNATSGVNYGIRKSWIKTGTI